MGEQVIGRLLKEKDMFLYWLLRAHESGNREGWEPGPSVDETIKGLCDVLANAGIDAHSSRAAEMLKQRPVYFVE